MSSPAWLVYDEDMDDPEGTDQPETPSLPGTKFYDNTIEIFFDPGPHVYYKFNAAGEREDIDGVTTVLGVINKPYLTSWAAKLTIETLKSLMLHPDGRIKDFSTEELFGWFQEAKNKHKERLNEAGDIGHLAHSGLETAIQYAIDNTGGIVLERPIVTDGPYNLAPEENIRKAQNCADRAYEWMRAHNIRWLSTERKVYSLEYNYSGTQDGDALVDSCSDRFCKGCRGREFKDRRAVIDWKSSNQLSDSYAYQVAAYQFAQIEEFPELYIPDRWILRLGKEEGDFEPWYIPDCYFEDDFKAFLAALELYRSVNKTDERHRAEKREFTAMSRAIKKAEREAAEVAEKLRKAEEREALKVAKKQWDADKTIFYKNLRSQKVPKAEAEKQRDEKFPASARPGFKEPEKPEEIETTVIHLDEVDPEQPQDTVWETKTVTVVSEPAAIIEPGTWKWKP